MNVTSGVRVDVLALVAVKVRVFSGVLVAVTVPVRVAVFAAVAVAVATRPPHPFSQVLLPPLNTPGPVWLHPGTWVLHTPFGPVSWHCALP